MDIKAGLSDSAGQDWPVLAMALHMEVGRFPRLYAHVEGVGAPPPGAMTFTLVESSNDAAALADLCQSTWHVCSSQVAVGQDRCLLMLMPDAACPLQVSPFAANQQDPASLLAGALSSGEITWDGESSASIEAFVSLWETPEQLARRVARLANEAFRLVPGEAQGWQLRWAGHFAGLVQPGVPDCSAGVSIVAETTHALEPTVQCVTVPCDFNEALLGGAGAARSFLVHRPMQLGVGGAEAVTADAPLAEAGTPLEALHARWHALADASQLDALWRGAHLSPDALSQDAMLSSLFLYDGKSSGSRIGQVSERFAELLGGAASVDHFRQGWAAYVLAVPVDALPQEKALVDRLLALHRVAPIWQALTQCVGCGFHCFEPEVPAWPASLPAVAVDNPGAPDSGTVSLTDDGMAYRTKIWVRVLGVEGDLEVDWATPFASHDNSANGGGSGGDLLLIPEAGTLGYVSFLGGQGAPYFHLNTHYRDATASSRVDPSAYKHGLVTDAGFQVEEASTNILIKAKVKITLRASRLLQELGESPEGVLAQMRAVTLDETLATAAAAAAPAIAAAVEKAVEEDQEEDEEEDEDSTQTDDTQETTK